MFEPTSLVAAPTARSDEPAAPPVPEIAALDAAARAVLAASQGAAGWGPAGRGAAIAVLDRVAGVLTAARGRVLTAERDEGTWAIHGERDFADWVGRTSRQGRGGGFAQAGQAATLATMPAVEQGLVDGPVTPAHVAAITRTAEASPVLGERLATPEGQAELVRLAGSLDAPAFGKALARRAAELDPAWRQRSHDEQRANRFLQISHTPGGALVKGRLDSVAGNLFQRAVDALNPRPAADDDRDHGQRQADALTAMARRILADKDTTPGALVPPQVTLVVREETWAALRAGAVARPAGAAGAGAAGAGAAGAGAAGAGSRGAGDRGAGSAADVVARLGGVPAVTDEDGNVWPASEIARVLCDDVLTRVVLGAAGVAVDEGRGKRLFTANQWRAIVAMDGGGCAFPGCHLPARYTDLHHLTWWDRDGGPTDVANGCQLCDFHHHEVHRRDIRVTRDGLGRLVFTLADGRPLPGTARPCAPPGNVEPLRRSA